VDWRKIKADYIAGGTSLRKLAEKYGVSFSTIQKKSMEEKWGELRKKNRRKVEEKIIDSVSTKEAEKAVNIIDVADKLLGKISDLMDAIPLDTQSMKHLTSALKDLKDIKGFKTDADMREQEARIRNLEKQAEADNASKDIEVQFGSEAEEYSR
jgi:uncharacterized protein YjcR